MTALSTLLTQSNTDELSTREIARRAEKNGHTLAQPTVSKYMSGRHGKPTEGVLAAFSDVLRIPIDQLREAAGVPTGTGEPWTPPAEANRLDLRQRRALEELIRSMVTSETTGQDQDDDDHRPDEQPAPATRRRAMADPPQPDGVKPDTGGHRSWAKARRPLQDDFARAADDSGPSLLERDDAEAARRGEESQDHEYWLDQN